MFPRSLVFLCLPFFVRCLYEASSSVRLKLSPLIGGPRFLPIHVQVIVEDHVWDFVPQNPVDPQTTLSLLRFQSVPGTIRCLGRKQRSSYLVEIAESFVYGYANRTSLHLVTNNCWTFALQLFLELKKAEAIRAN